MNFKKILFFSIIIPLFTLGFELTAASSIYSVVKIYVVSSPPDFHNPWQNLPDRSATGSGCLISKDRILTCAHIVRNSTFIMVRKQGDPKKYIAKLVVVGEDCDLAILKVENPAFYKGMKTLKIGTLPLLQDSVSVLGYPVGGDNISITKGVVSRIEPTVYAYSGRWLLGAQIDAAINPGNSGGPVIKDGELVGIAFQGLARTNSIGYMIPAPVIKHFLKDIAKNKGKYEGFPSMGIYFDGMENPSLRKWAKMKEDQSGIMITHLLPAIKKTSGLQKNDVLLAIDGVKIANDGSIPFREDENILFPSLIWKKYVGDTANITILRDGKIIELKQLLTKSAPLVPSAYTDSQPPYYILGGFVFTKLTTNYIDSPGSRSKPSLDMLYLLKRGEVTTKRNQVVLLSKVLADNFNIGYQSLSNQIVEKVNGVPVKNLKQFVSLIEKTNNKFLTITLGDYSKIVIDHSAALQATSNILKRYHIDSDRSENLK